VFYLHEKFPPFFEAAITKELAAIGISGAEGAVF
jgi:hypothetical protein